MNLFLSLLLCICLAVPGSTGACLSAAGGNSEAVTGVSADTGDDPAILTAVPLPGRLSPTFAESVLTGTAPATDTVPTAAGTSSAESPQDNASDSTTETTADTAAADAADTAADADPESTQDNTSGGATETTADTATADAATPAAADQAALNIAAPSVILMEASTGTVIYEKNSHERLHPASITKIMTLLLIFDALERGQISLSDTVTVSEYAASMGGSQVYLEPGETQTVETMIKCISVASANDACVAMAEHICGSETEFVRQMNERAKGLGMADTTFVNCCGLDADGHMTSAHDVALMSRELIIRHPDIHNYSTIWMENITHTTAKGTSEFGLANTNKLIRQYQYATGLKTGFTSLAKYCVSATAKKDDMELIAVIMAAPDPKARSADATALLNYGFGQCHIYSDVNADKLPPLAVEKGIAEYVNIEYASPFSYVSTDGSDLSGVEKRFELPESVAAPVKKGGVAGRAVYTLNGREIGSVSLLYTGDVPVATYKDYFMKALSYYLT